MKTIKKLLLLITPIVFLFSCDIYEEDNKPIVVDLGDIDLYTTPGSPAIAYSRAHFNQVYEKGISFNQIESTSNGIVQTLENGEFLQYIPSVGVQSDQDNVLVEVVSSSGKKLAKANLRIIPASDCGYGPVTTQVTISNTESFQLELLNNNIWCGTYKESGPFVVLDTEGNPLWNFDYDENFIGDFNILFSPETPGLIEYVPQEGFVGTETLYYCLTTDYKFGKEFQDEFWLHPEWWEHYYSGKLEIHVTE